VCVCLCVCLCVCACVCVLVCVCVCAFEALMHSRLSLNDSVIEDASLE